MNKVNWISLAALAALVIAIPVYGMMEPVRMVQSKAELRQQHVEESIQVYLDNCALCHGVDGAGTEAMPALNNKALASARSDALFNTIARAAHGATMAAWHLDEGGILTDYQVNGLVTLIQSANWNNVQRTAVLTGYEKPFTPAVDTSLAAWDLNGEGDPHACVECHEDPVVHLGTFGINCAMCHDTVAWTPAALTRHPFLLDHGGDGEVACETCHPNNYVEYDCYGCHNDHQAEAMETAHQAEKIFEFADCAECHPTGISGEADALRNSQPTTQGVKPAETGEISSSSEADR